MDSPVRTRTLDVKIQLSPLLETFFRVPSGRCEVILTGSYVLDQVNGTNHSGDIDLICTWRGFYHILQSIPTDTQIYHKLHKEYLGMLVYYFTLENRKYDLILSPCPESLVKHFDLSGNQVYYDGLFVQTFGYWKPMETHVNDWSLESIQAFENGITFPSEMRRTYERCVKYQERGYKVFVDDEIHVFDTKHVRVETQDTIWDSYAITDLLPYSYLSDEQQLQLTLERWHELQTKRMRCVNQIEHLKTQVDEIHKELSTTNDTFVDPVLDAYTDRVTELTKLRAKIALYPKPSTKECSICYQDRTVFYTYQCGHVYCDECSTKSPEQCFGCRGKSKRIKLFL